jgi:UDP-N-acetylmuramoylalanine--D-glutamate ligase
MIYVKNKKVSILGAARSGLAAAQLLAKKGATIFLSDISQNRLTPELEQKLTVAGIKYEFGRHSDRLFDADFLVISPGIPLKAGVIQEAMRRKIPVVSEIELAFWYAYCPIIAVTGSNGKSTTTSLIAHLLQAAGKKAVACGNLGKPFSEAVLETSEDKEMDYFVVECSSFQLETISLFAPHCAVLLNLTPDHLDRYDSFEAYAQSKMAIFSHQNIEKYAVLNFDDPNVMRLAKTKARVLPVSMKPMEGAVAWYDNNMLYIRSGDDIAALPADEILLPGEHNRYNILSALSAVVPFLKSLDGLEAGLKSFRSIPHRLEFIAEIDGVLYYNDSKATNLDSVKVAIRSFKSPVHLILGGRDKNGDFTELAQLLTRHVRHIYTIGEAAEKIERQLRGFPMTHSGDLKQAVADAAGRAHSGEIVLLSPGCASFDQYKNFEERGEHFRNLVEAIR